MKAIDRLRDAQETISKIIEDESPVEAYDWAVVAQAVLDLEDLVLKVARTAREAYSEANSIGRER